MSLHDRIARIQITKESGSWPTGERIIYKTGFVDAREEAAKLASETDSIMADMIELLQSCNFDNNTDMREADALVKKYKEPTK